MYHVIVHCEKSGIPHIRESGLQADQVSAKYEACTRGSQCTMLQVPLEWACFGSELFCGLPYPLLSSFARAMLVSLAVVSCFYVGGFITCAPLLGMSKIVPTLMMESKTALRMEPGVDGLGTPLKRAVTKAA
ncbi:hypothetical protein C8J56DRAFT_900153 [Mycena floridula]|nr:hypothetical protein C8J56DRAFT_900153 [Mycena floridula]